ncbi:unnamed protein product [Hymenolepis diminuta]|uniref:Uncharacterized protein n=1 Tax=Hymenolepis diminuta TaxID=6216 RepID=A0A564YYX3_HYMDI|nr:unnamed protein product [Hymenolepis diminuta]
MNWIEWIKSTMSGIKIYLYFPIYYSLQCIFSGSSSLRLRSNPYRVIRSLDDNFPPWRCEMHLCLQSQRFLDQFPLECIR